MPVDLSDFEPLTEAKQGLDLSDFEPITKPASTLDTSDFEPINLQPTVQPVQPEPLLKNTVEYPPEEPFTAPEFPSTLTPQPPPKPEESGFLASAGAQAASGFIGSTVGALEKALTPKTAFDNLQDARIGVERLNAQLGAIRGKQSRGEALSAQETAALDTIPKQIAEGQRVVRRFTQIAGSPTQEALRDIGEQARRSANAIRREDIPDIWQRYGAEPESTNITAQVGRGIGDFLLMVPAMSTGNIGTAAIVLQGAARAYNDAKTAGASEAEANTAALKTAPGLMLYMVGGRLAAGAVSKLMSDTASPMAKALAGFAGAEVANVGAGSVIRAMEGQDWRPNAETFTMDTLFALFHGFGEYGKASAESRQRAYFELQNRGLTPDQIKTRASLRYDVTPADVVTTSLTPLTDAAFRETSTQPKQETPNASQEPTAAQVGVRGEGGEMGQSPPLRYEGQAPEARPEVQAEVTPPIPQPAAEGQAKGVTRESPTTPQAAVVGAATPPTTITVWKAQRRVGDVKEGPRLGEFYTSSEEAANRLADLTGDVTQHTLTLENSLVIPPKVEGFEYYDSTELDEIFKKAGVKFKFGDEVLDEEVWRLIDEGGNKLVNALRNAGYDSIQFPEHIGGKEQTTTLVFDKPKESKAYERQVPTTKGTGQQQTSRGIQTPPGGAADIPKPASVALGIPVGGGEAPEGISGGSTGSTVSEGNLGEVRAGNTGEAVTQPPKEVTPNAQEKVQGREEQVAEQPPIAPSVQPAGETVEQPPVTESTSPAAKAAERPAEQAAVPPAEAPKEPWQMTRKEYNRFGAESYLAGGARREFINSFEKWMYENKKTDFDAENTKIINDRPVHRAAVKWALEQGKPVPSEVLAEYSDLKATAEAPKPAAEVPKAGPVPFTPEGLAAEPKERVGLIPGVSSLSPVSVLRMVTNVVGWLRPRGHKPAEAYERLQIRDSERAAADRDIAYASRDLLKALRKQYGLSRLEMLGGGSRRIPVTDVQLMTEYLKGNPTVGAAIPTEIRGILRTMRDDINGASQRVIDRLQWDLNHAPVGSAKAKRIQDLINTIQSNMDVYVHRSYKFFDAKDNAPDWYAKLPTSIRQNAENYLQSTSPTPLTPAEARAKLLNWLSDLKDAGSFGTAGKVGAKDPSILMRRKVIPKELRAVLGEYNSPLAVYAKSMSKMSSWVANHKFLTDVKDMGMGRWLFEDDMAPPGFNTKIAAEGSDSMSPLNGLRTSPEIAEAFTNLNAIRERSGITGAAAKLWFSAIAQSKFAATVQSTMTQARNLLSRPLMAAMAGHWNPAPLAKGVKALYADMIGSDKTWQQYTREAYKYGVLGDTAHGAELQAILKDAALQDVAPADLYSWSLMRAVKMVGWDAPAKVYRASDELGNLVGWENEMASQRKIHPTWTDDQIKAEAAKIVREIYPTYSETPELVQFFRKVPLTGPFVTFPYQIIRTMWNSTSRGLVEMRSSNAEERKVGAKRLAGVTFALMAGTAAQELSKALLGIRSEEEDDFRLFQPPWARNAKFLFTDKDQKTGELSAINLSYIDPYSYMTDPVMAIISTARRKEPIDETISRAATEFFRPWISEQMLPAALIDSARITTQMGGKVYNKTDDAWTKAVKIGKHIGATLVPGTIQRVERRIIPAARDEQPEYGRKLELGREIARELSGIAFEKFNFGTGLANKVRAFDEARENAEDVFRETATQTQRTSPQDVLEAYQDSDMRRFAAFREMRQVYLAALRRGVSIAEARRIMESRGMNAAASSMIARGIYRPMQVTDQVRRRAADVKRTLPMNEIQQIVQKERSLD